ncbi:binder of sperm protein homolog 1 [Eptesicus fuscus]|uniref:binder of sperm protein homolog 1 n=1 Tax=Eptesicus fuscus TaxID=29078 RepID=UPI0024041B2C|nr:binder of sperm protein homolog 1 [Eptesicus fuscus]
MGRRAGLLLAWACGLLSTVSAEDYSPTPEAMPYFPEMKDGKCFFPFHYKNGVFYDCVKFKAKHKWCSLTQNFEGYWKYCSDEDLAKCVFPFWYRRTIYWGCTDDADAFGRKWCSLTQNFNKERVWKFCQMS